MNEMRYIWIVRGYQSLPNDHEAPKIVYEHAFGTRDDADALLSRGETELPTLYWTRDRMNYGQVLFANYMFESLVTDMEESNDCA